MEARGQPSAGAGEAAAPDGGRPAAPGGGRPATPGGTCAADRVALEREAARGGPAAAGAIKDTNV